MSTNCLQRSQNVRNSYRDKYCKQQRPDGEGAHGAPEEKRRKLLAELDALVEADPGRILPFDAQAAAAWGEYVSRPALKSKPKGYADTMIAAIAFAAQFDRRHAQYRGLPRSRYN